MFWGTGLASLLKQGTAAFLKRCCSEIKAGNITSNAAAWNATKIAHCRQKTRSAGTGMTAATRSIAELINVADSTIGPVHCNTSGDDKFLLCVDSIRNISLMAKPTLKKGRTCTLSKFIGKPIRLHTPSAAAAELARTSTPRVARQECATQPYTARAAKTTPSLKMFILECSSSILFNVAVENVLKWYDDEELFPLVKRSISWK